ncbi:MAG: 6-phosphogluconolactonase [Planctomycetes bacterium]|nr:6-phosphogluconolactonase [Planctomycetota bacterium]
MKTPETKAGGARRTVRVLDDLDAVTAAGRERFLAAAERAIRDHGVFRVALAGGSTPKKLYAALVGAPIDWSKVLVFFGDERCVPPTHADSNYRMAREALLSKVVIPGSNVHRIYAESGDVRAAAQEYEDELERVWGLIHHEMPRFDLVLLGMGPDGHTVSLFPGTQALAETKKRVVANHVEKLGAWRITFTPPVINAAREVVFLVAGADKAGVLREVLEGPRDPQRLPAQLVQPDDGELVWIVDRAAAAELAPRA